MPYRNSDQKRAYQAKWVQQKRARVRAAYLAGKTCAQCGSTDELQLHHRDPAQKISHRIWTWSEPRRLAELAKCDLLCRRCHQALHARWRAQKRQHGTTTMYRRGCRCERCATAAVAYNRARRARRKPAAAPVQLPLPIAHPASADGKRAPVHLPQRRAATSRRKARDYERQAI